MVSDMPTQSAKVDREHIDYTAHAHTYDKKRFEGRQNSYLESLRYRAFIHCLKGVDRDSKTLDVGCGTGRGLQYLTQAGFHRITGLDYTEAMLALAQEKIKSMNCPTPIELICGDAFQLPFEPSQFDVVIALNFFHMFRLDLQQRLIREMARVCVPGGRLVLEFESLHKGLFFTRYWEQRRLRHRTKFTSYWELNTLLPTPEFSNRKIYGTSLPLVHRLFCHAPEFGRLCETITLLPLINWMSERIFATVVVNKKP